MKQFLPVFLSMALMPLAQASEPLTLGNDAWPPFIIEGEEKGTAETLVCMALERSGWPCSVRVADWESVLQDARTGAIDGIAAIWDAPGRDEFLLYSEPYLTNRIVPVVGRDGLLGIERLSDLAGLRVSMVTGYSYGEEIDVTATNFEVVDAANAKLAIEAVRSGRADVALVDELVARDIIAEPGMDALTQLDSVLAFRSLYFAVSRQRKDGRAIIADFHRSYKAMLSEGLVNDILDVDWLATDFGHTGRVDLVLRSGSTLDKVSHPSRSGSVYALERSEYQFMQENELSNERVKYQVEGKSYSTLQSALDNVFGKNVGCEHKEFSSEFDCTNLFKSR